MTVNRFNALDHQDTSAALWDDLYLVRTPQIQSTSIGYMREYGNYTTTDKAIDEALSRQWMTQWMPINQMVDFYADGVQIKIAHYSDTKVIYDKISLHLNAWKNRLEYGINIADAPVADLVQMDLFAHAVYEHAQYHFTPDTLSSALAQNLSSAAGFNKYTFFTRKTATTREEFQEDNKVKEEGVFKLPQRESLGGFLKSHISGITSRDFNKG